ncbi:hypothetical protein [Acidithrix ferrooxidans]|uniref:Uncharacterized protein n=1 Tax=Acidithrix ferrooxidans TaxID=1280514 RepID=A0A0D8HCK4_9ACTN|nr:hypothetical protein [Acidithrix ferrooxidans]KJF15619.1 hypothetical protein AXFE_35430 [Acidithrix ferrooxidans]
MEAPDLIGPDEFDQVAVVLCLKSLIVDNLKQIDNFYQMAFDWLYLVFVSYFVEIRFVTLLCGNSFELNIVVSYSFGKEALTS